MSHLRCEYFLTDYLYKYGNFNASTIKSAYNIEGYFDNYNLDKVSLKSSTNILTMRKKGGYHDSVNKKRVYEFVIIPNCGFLNSPEPLMKDCELKLSFDRSKPFTSVIDIGTSTPSLSDPIEIKNAVAITEYVSSPNLRNYFDTIDFEPMRYNYDSCQLMVKSIPTNETEVRFDNLFGGNVPLVMFVAVIQQNALKGDASMSSTMFKDHNVEQMDFTLNGNSVHGFPMIIQHKNAVKPLQKFLDSTDRYYNVVGGESLSLIDFDYNWIWSHKFEGEISDQGWVGVNMKLKSPFSASMTLVVWIISPERITIDKFHKVERLTL